MELAEFLAARIAEDEMQAAKHQEAASRHGFGDYPARVLIECEVKRRIVALHAHQEGFFTPDELRALALPYADHPDYRQEWRP